ncbi:hypothetical protein GO003_014845 [Methylicorpusculum oleiharenae]|uniref:hypothetical protein n=1 Tax=Methylicorpusculum oleiharenae TaxID=1338687 RepID=UPI001359E3FB|nr:hypothetical protein [Methylicorpusculum oleiharenae]MCD2451670.1 hypothetical protein [Methylicorpusculum oleiharenae]
MHEAKGDLSAENGFLTLQANNLDRIIQPISFYLFFLQAKFKILLVKYAGTKFMLSKRRSMGGLQSIPTGLFRLIFFLQPAMPLP